MGDVVIFDCTLVLLRESSNEDGVVLWRDERDRIQLERGRHDGSGQAASRAHLPVIPEAAGGIMRGDYPLTVAAEALGY